MIDLSDEALFCELPTAGGQSERDACLHEWLHDVHKNLGVQEEADGSLAYAYDKEFKARYPSEFHWDFEDLADDENITNANAIGKVRSSARQTIEKECRNTFISLVYMVQVYLEDRRPIRRFPESCREFFGSHRSKSGRDWNLYVDLDFIKQVQNDGDDKEWSAPNPKRYDEAYQEISDYVKSKSTLSYCLGYVVTFFLCLALAWWSLGEFVTMLKLGNLIDLWALLPFLKNLPFFTPASNWIWDVFPVLDIIMFVAFGALVVWSMPKTLYGLLFILFGFDVGHQKKQAGKFCQLVEECAVSDYRFARFCQLWCEAEGREVPELFPACMADAKLALERRDAILRRWPEFARSASSKD